MLAQGRINLNWISWDVVSLSRAFLHSLLPQLFLMRVRICFDIVLLGSLQEDSNSHQWYCVSATALRWDGLIPKLCSTSSISGIIDWLGDKELFKVIERWDVSFRGTISTLSVVLSGVAGRKCFLARSNRGVQSLKGFLWLVNMVV